VVPERGRTALGRGSHVVSAGTEQERLEGWIMAEVGKGAALPGLYPANAETRARYEAWRASGEGLAKS
jgi:hypothetical protein